MKNKDTVINLNEGEIVPACNNDEHQFIMMVEPTHDQSGWHEKQCRWCGVKVVWDDSD